MAFSGLAQKEIRNAHHTPNEKSFLPYATYTDPNPFGGCLAAFLGGPMHRRILASLLMMAVWCWLGAASEAKTLEHAVFGGGCFWAMQAEFELVKGVDSAVPGYAGGSVPNPSYGAVCSGTTGHAEVVDVAFDPKVISYRDLVKVFMGAHDPTTVNRQGPDSGTNYRSVILTSTPAQALTARSVIAELRKNKAYADPIVTEVKPLAAFYRAEEHHQHYYAQHPNEPYTAGVVAGEVARFKAKFGARLK
jgi:peptide-methionine (S)-S-oxide reductase